MVEFGQLRIEHLSHVVAVFLVGFVVGGSVFLLNQTVYGVAVHARKTALFKLLFKHVSHRRVELPLHEQHAVSFCLCSFDVCVFGLFVVGVKVDDVAVLVGLVVFYKCVVLVVGKVFAVDVLEEGERLGAVVEIRFGKQPGVDEQLEVVPFLFEFLAVLLEYALQAVGNLFGDVRGDFLYVRVALQVAAAYVERNVGRVNYAMK